MAQRLMAFALRHGDIKDHDRLRDDNLPVPAVGRTDILGSDRLRTAQHRHAARAHRRFTDRGRQDDLGQTKRRPPHTCRGKSRISLNRRGTG